MISEYVDHMGTDLSVVNAARVSFANVSGWDVVDGVNQLKAGDRNLINYLARGVSSKEWREVISKLSDTSDIIWIEDKVNQLMDMATHWTPFTHTAITLRMSAPVPIRTQCFKHKVGFTENEESRRYISSRPELYIPDSFRSASPDKKQGSGADHPQSAFWLEEYKINCENMINLYEDMISHLWVLPRGGVARSVTQPGEGATIKEYGIAPEQARLVLPQGVEVNWIWTGNLAAYARFYNQRVDPHAQLEVQNLANQVGEIIAPLYPVSWEALTKGK